MGQEEMARPMRGQRAEIMVEQSRSAPMATLQDCELRKLAE